jgi:hypothetical protein
LPCWTGFFYSFAFSSFHNKTAGVNSISLGHLLMRSESSRRCFAMRASKGFLLVLLLSNDQNNVNGNAAVAWFSWWWCLVVYGGVLPS